MSQTYALIIEDDRKQADIFALALQTADFKTKVITDGQKALEALTTESPDIIVLDLHLPHVSGTEILKHIQADERLKSTRVIVTTADAQVGELLHKTADLVLLKPVSIDQLIGLANRLR